MRAAVLRQLRQPFEITEVPEPVLGPEDALVQVRACGICRTDLHIQDGLAYVPQLPHIAGHEPSGVVAAVGARVSNVQVGQRVVPYLFLTCGQCRYCRTGYDAQCVDCAGVLGVTCAGGFAEYFVAPARNLLPLPETIPFEVGGLVSCAVITAVHALRQSAVRLGETAVVVGMGGIGQLLVQLLKATGAHVVAVARSPESLRIAEQFGADRGMLFNGAGGPLLTRDFLLADGADCVFDCVGTAGTMHLAAQLVRRAGRIVVIGEEPEFPAIDTVAIAQRELQIMGSRNGSRQDALDALDMLTKEVIRPRIAARFSLANINEALELLRSGQSRGRIVIEIA